MADIPGSKSPAPAGLFSQSKRKDATAAGRWLRNHYGRRGTRRPKSVGRLLLWPCEVSPWWRTLLKRISAKLLSAFSLISMLK